MSLRVGITGTEGVKRKAEFRFDVAIINSFIFRFIVTSSPSNLMKPCLDRNSNMILHTLCGIFRASEISLIEHGFSLKAKKSSTSSI